MDKSRAFLVFFLFLALMPFSLRAEESRVDFFYSRTCPHCAAEKRFLEELKKEKEGLEVNIYPVSKPENRERLESFYQEYEVDLRKRGVVPATFVGEHCFVGFESSSTTGKKIRKALEGTLSEKEGCGGDGGTVQLPLVGEIDVSRYSLPALTVLMGGLDGFNVCSLGALVLILGLVLNLRSREKVLVYGGLFVVVTSVVYGILIVLWYKLFSLLSAYLRAMEIVIGLLGITGGLYFLKEFISFRKEGPTCEAGGKKMAGRFLDKVRSSISEDGVEPFALAGSILLFAAVLTVVEFPCSAAVPVVYAGLLAEADLGSFAHLLYISLFVLLYMLDELLVFGFAVWKMSVWMTSGHVVTWITLVESLVLFGLGAFYLLGI